MNKEKRDSEFKRILQEELQLIQGRPSKSSKVDLIGLAFSGGGIRSAAFTLGILHALVKRNKLKDVDYLSTVSGGGYIATALSWLLYCDREKGDDLLGKERFPLGSSYDGSESSRRNDYLNYIRQHSSYLLPGKGLDLMALLGVILKGVVLGSCAYFPFMIGMFYLLKFSGFFTFFDKMLVGMGSLFATASVLYSFSTWLQSSFGKGVNGSRSQNINYRRRVKWEQIGGKLLISGLLMGVLGSVQLVAEELRESLNILSFFPVGIILGMTGIVLDRCLTGLKKAVEKPLTYGTQVFLVNGLGVLSMYALFLTAYMIAEEISFLHFSITLGIGLCVGFFVNLNLVGIHRTYRDRLMEAFMPDQEAVAADRWGLSKTANSAKLTDQKCSPGPYHLYCCSVDLNRSQDPKFRGRGADSFILSPLYCGSYATGWSSTEAFMQGSMDPATAMAISGAALSPHMGSAGRGLTRSTIVSFLMTFFNLRQGYWVENPQKKSIKKTGLIPNFFKPGLLSLLGVGQTEYASFIELTDGGHFENLSAYELIRRRVKTILISDAGCDPAQSFEDLGNLIERVRVDFGVDIEFQNLGSKLAQPVIALNPIYSQKGYAVAVIRYPSEQGLSYGQLYYIKSSLIDSLPADIYAYQRAHPSFPNQTTFDQFFDEQTFEAYRELGYRQGLNLLEVVDDKWQLHSEV
jgi:hypothetical protein